MTALLLESGETLLLESGERLLLESGGLARTSMVTAQSSGSFGAGSFSTGAFTPPNNSLVVAVLGATANNATDAAFTSALTIADSVGGLTWTQELIRLNAYPSFPSA